MQHDLGFELRGRVLDPAGAAPIDFCWRVLPDAAAPPATLWGAVLVDDERFVVLRAELDAASNIYQLVSSELHQASSAVGHAAATMGAGVQDETPRPLGARVSYVRDRMHASRVPDADEPPTEATRPLPLTRPYPYTTRPLKPYDDWLLELWTAPAADDDADEPASAAGAVPGQLVRLREAFVELGFVPTTKAGVALPAVPSAAGRRPLLVNYTNNLVPYMARLEPLLAGRGRLRGAEAAAADAVSARVHVYATASAPGALQRLLASNDPAAELRALVTQAVSLADRLDPAGMAALAAWQEDVRKSRAPVAMPAPRKPAAKLRSAAAAAPPPATTPTTTATTTPAPAPAPAPAPTPTTTPAPTPAPAPAPAPAPPPTTTPVTPVPAAPAPVVPPVTAVVPLPAAAATPSPAATPGTATPPTTGPGTFVPATPAGGASQIPSAASTPSSGNLTPTAQLQVSARADFADAVKAGGNSMLEHSMFRAQLEELIPPADALNATKTTEAGLRQGRVNCFANTAFIVLFAACRALDAFLVRNDITLGAGAFFQGADNPLRKLALDFARAVRSGQQFDLTEATLLAAMRSSLPDDPVARRNFLTQFVAAPQRSDLTLADLPKADFDKQRFSLSEADATEAMTFVVTYAFPSYVGDKHFAEFTGSTGTVPSTPGGATPQPPPPSEFTDPTTTASIIMWPVAATDGTGARLPNTIEPPRRIGRYRLKAVIIGSIGHYVVLFRNPDAPRGLTTSDGKEWLYWDPLLAPFDAAANVRRFQRPVPLGEAFVNARLLAGDSAQFNQPFLGGGNYKPISDAVAFVYEYGRAQFAIAQPLAADLVGKHAADDDDDDEAPALPLADVIAAELWVLRDEPDVLAAAELWRRRDKPEDQPKPPVVLSPEWQRFADHVRLFADKARDAMAATAPPPADERAAERARLAAVDASLQHAARSTLRSAVVELALLYSPDDPLAVNTELVAVVRMLRLAAEPIDDAALLHRLLVFLVAEEPAEQELADAYADLGDAVAEPLGARVHHSRSWHAKHQPKGLSLDEARSLAKHAKSPAERAFMRHEAAVLSHKQHPVGDDLNTGDELVGKRAHVRGEEHRSPAWHHKHPVDVSAKEAKALARKAEAHHHPAQALMFWTRYGELTRHHHTGAPLADEAVFALDLAGPLAGADELIGAKAHHSRHAHVHGIPPWKAQEMLKHPPHGHKLTPAQHRMLEAKAHGY